MQTKAARNNDRFYRLLFIACFSFVIACFPYHLTYNEIEQEGRVMDELFDLTKFDAYREDNRREVKKAKGGLPLSLWETYSAFANCQGGVIILGVSEDKDGSWKTTGLKNETRLRKEFWDTVNNAKKVSVNLLRDKDVETFIKGENVIMVIRVPSAPREEKPVYINDDVFGGTFRRNWEGDYRCTKFQVKTMIRDQADETIDMTVLDDMGLDVLNAESVHAYRNIFSTRKLNHPFSRLGDEEFLRSIGAVAPSKNDGKIHPTAAGLLMFGNEFDIVRQFPNHFLDYRSELDPSNRWDDRMESSSGDWSGNVFDFYFRVYNKLKQALTLPFRLSEGKRIDDTPVHEAIREALANCLINADYYGSRGVVIVLREKRISFANPGYSRTEKQQMLKGGVSDPRNRGLMKMFNLIDIGERAGSGVPKILNIWKGQRLKSPFFEEQFDPDRVILVLPLEKKKSANEADLGIKRKKTAEIEAMIMDYLKDNGKSTCAEIADYVRLSQPRTRAILSKMEGVQPIGANRCRTYRSK